MKLLRYGLRGQEKPGILDGDGEIRDLSGIVPDIAGAVILPESIEKLRSIDLSRLPQGARPSRVSAPAWARRKIRLYRLELFRSRG